MSATVLLLLIPSGLILLAILIAAVYSARQRAAGATREGVTIPPSRRPGPTDEALDGRLLEKYQAAGLVLTLFLAVFLPALLVMEPGRQRSAAAEELARSRQHGHATFEQFCSRCHGENATGGVVKRFKPPNRPDAKPADYQAPDLTKIWERHPGERVADVAHDTIDKGRPGTPMPTWGVRNGGAMNDAQLTDLVNWLLSIQSDNKPRDPVEFKALGLTRGGYVP